jgi:regulatory protein
MVGIIISAVVSLAIGGVASYFISSKMLEKKLGNAKNVAEKTLKDAVFDSEVKSAVEKSSSYLAIRMHSKRELYDKLIKKGYEKQVSLKALEKHEEYHYIDDYLFSKQFAEQNKKLSKKMIENKLKQKGVSSDIIFEIIGNQGDDEEFERCKIAAEKYAKSKDLSDASAVQKMYASLARKGFSFDTIKKACKSLIMGIDNEDNFLD